MKIELKKLPVLGFSFLTIIICSISAFPVMAQKAESISVKEQKVETKASEKPVKADESTKTIESKNDTESTVKSVQPDDLSEIMQTFSHQYSRAFLIISLLLTLLLLWNIFLTYLFLNTIKELNKKMAKNVKEIKENHETSIKAIKLKHSDTITKINNYFGNLEKRLKKLESERIISQEKPSAFLNQNIQLEKPVQDYSVEFIEPENFNFENTVKDDPVTLICNEHFELTNRDFKDKFEHKILEMPNAREVAYKKVTPIFEAGNTGKYIAIKNPDKEQLNFLVFYAKGTNISSNESEVSAVFNFDEELENGKLYSNWKVIKPAVFIENDNNWQLKEKGTIQLENSLLG